MGTLSVNGARDDILPFSFGFGLKTWRKIPREDVFCDY